MPETREELVEAASGHVEDKRITFDKRFDGERPPSKLGGQCCFATIMFTRISLKTALRYCLPTTTRSSKKTRALGEHTGRKIAFI